MPRLREGNTVSPAFHCADLLSVGFQNNSLRDIESGLSLAYDLFVLYTTQGRNEELRRLARYLNAAFLPHRIEQEATNKRLTYLTQLRSLINLADYISLKEVTNIDER